MVLPRGVRNVKELIRLLERGGFHVERRTNNHLKITHPRMKRAVFTASSPSDHRSWQNAMSEIKRNMTTDEEPKK